MRGGFLGNNRAGIAPRLWREPLRSGAWCPPPDDSCSLRFALGGRGGIAASEPFKPKAREYLNFVRPFSYGRIEPGLTDHHGTVSVGCNSELAERSQRSSRVDVLTTRRGKTAVERNSPSPLAVTGSRGLASSTRGPRSGTTPPRLVCWLPRESYPSVALGMIMWSKCTSRGPRIAVSMSRDGTKILVLWSGHSTR